MANTVPDGIYYPDSNTLMNLDAILATMASSIQNGIGKRLSKLETFVGCNLSTASAVTGTAGIVKVTTFGVQSDTVAPGSFNQGMTINNGTVTVPEDGLYSVMFVANFLPTSTTVARLNTYIFVNGVNYNYSSAASENVTNRYSNCNISGIYNLKKNDQIDVRIAVYDGQAVLTQGTGSAFCVSLVSRTIT